jgi:hypothetical protein
LQAALHWAYLGKPEKSGAATQTAPTSSKTATKHPNAAGLTKLMQSSTSTSAPAASPDDDKPVLKGYAGALLAAEVVVADDRRSTSFLFASDRLVPVDWTVGGSQLAPVAVEVAGCAAEPATNVKDVSRALGKSSQLYPLLAHVPKKAKGDEKEKPTVALSVATAELLTYEKQPSKTRITVDLGDKPKTGFAITSAGAIIDAIGPASRVEQRADGSYLVKESGTVDITFANVLTNRTIDIDLKPVDEKNKLGASVAKLVLTARAAKS